MKECPSNEGFECPSFECPPHEGVMSVICNEGERERVRERKKERDSGKERKREKMKEGERERDGEREGDREKEVEADRERWGAGVETQKNVRGEIGGWGRVPFNEPYAPS